MTPASEASIAFDDNPYPNEPGFQFGLVDEEYAGDRKDIDTTPQVFR